jgi:hypothetical protein
VAEPVLSVLAVRRIGWTKDDYIEWSSRMMREQVAFVVPSLHEGEPMLRLCIVNPRTSADDIRVILDSMR